MVVGHSARFGAVRFERIESREVTEGRDEVSVDYYCSTFVVKSLAAEAATMSTCCGTIPSFASVGSGASTHEGESSSKSRLQL